MKKLSMIFSLTLILSGYTFVAKADLEGAKSRAQAARELMNDIEHGFDYYLDKKEIRSNRKQDFLDNYKIKCGRNAHAANKICICNTGAGPMDEDGNCEYSQAPGETPLDGEDSGNNEGGNKSGGGGEVPPEISIGLNPKSGDSGGEIILTTETETQPDPSTDVVVDNGDEEDVAVDNNSDEGTSGDSNSFGNNEGTSSGGGGDLTDSNSDVDKTNSERRADQG